MCRACVRVYVGMWLLCMHMCLSCISTWPVCMSMYMHVASMYVSCLARVHVSAGLLEACSHLRCVLSFSTLAASPGCWQSKGRPAWCERICVGPQAPQPPVPVGQSPAGPWPVCAGLQAGPISLSPHPRLWLMPCVLPTSVAPAIRLRTTWPCPLSWARACPPARSAPRAPGLGPFLLSCGPSRRSLWLAWAPCQCVV